MNAVKKQVPTQGAETKEVKPTMTVSKPSAVVNPTEEVKPTPTLQQLKDKATTVFLLQEKHTKLSEKRASLEKFTITHENENATVIVRDVNGLEFKSASPKTIGKLLEFWKEEFGDAIIETENDLKKAFELVA